MDTTQLKAFCAAFAGAQERDSGAPANILVYSIGGKTFAYFKTSEPERWRFSFKASPERFLELTDIPGIRPARWRGRHRWVTVVDVRTTASGELFRVRLGPWTSREAAEAARERVAALGYAEAVVAAP